MTIEVIDRLYESGDLRSLIHSGLVDPAVLEWRKIFHAYNKRVKEDGVKRSKAANDIASVFNVNRSTVYNILKRMS